VEEGNTGHKMTQTEILNQAPALPSMKAVAKDGFGADL
jgi:hypothetical protein